jgi:ABC-type uncharacterized transport system permease subunit
MIATIDTTAAAAATTATTEAVNPYEAMTADELRSELAGLDAFAVKQQLQIKQLTDASLNMIKDFSVIILAHMKGDVDGVHAGLDAIVKKNVIVTPSSKDLH